MNPLTFAEIINDLPADIIESADGPYSRSLRWYQISAVAACIVLMISAAVYPKLRTQTPEIVSSPTVVSETTVATTTQQERTDFTTATPESKSSTTQTTAHPASVTSRTTTTATVTMHTTAQNTLATASVGTTAPRQTAAPERTETPQTDQPATTTQKQTTKPVLIGSTTVTTVTTTAPQPEPLTVPLWTGYVIYPGGIWDEPPYFHSSFRWLPSNQYEFLREEFDIPPEFDLTQNQCLEITIQTAYAKAAIVGCHYKENGLTFTIGYLENSRFTDQILRYAIPVPENLSVSPDSCIAKYVEMTDEEMYQALLTNSLTVEMDD